MAEGRRVTCGALLTLVGCALLGLACPGAADPPPADDAGPDAPDLAEQDLVEPDLAEEDLGEGEDALAELSPEPDDLLALPEGTAPAADPTSCASDDGEGWVSIPEASGAVRFPDGTLLITADSSHRGRGLFITPDGVEHAMTFPLDGPTHPSTGEFTDDDIEGLDLGTDGLVYGLTSAGWMRVWERDGLTLTLTGPSYAIASDPAWVCENRAVNCGPNYEGLCLRPEGIAPFESETAGCVGFAASRGRSELICLVRDDEGRLSVDTERVLTTPLTADHLSDCAYAPPEETGGRPLLLLAGNLYARSALWWLDEETGTFTETGLTGAANQEALVPVGGRRWKSFGDLQTLTPDSPWVSFVCGVGAPPEVP